MKKPLQRVLITGSRNWIDDTAINVALAAVWKRLGSPSDAVLVHGDCPTGADPIASRIWASRGFTVEAHPANWRPNGVYNPAAGLHRNTKMVRLGADYCLAFIRNGSPGATHASLQAEKAGIPTLRIRNDG